MTLLIGQPGLAERNAAIHAARALVARLLVLQREDELAVVRDPFGGRQRAFGEPLQLHEAGDLAHHAASFCLGDAAGFAAVCLACISPSARLYSFGNTLTNLPRARLPVVEDRERAGAAGVAQMALDQLAQQRLVQAPDVRSVAPCPPLRARARAFA